MSRYIDADALAHKVIINGDVDFINKVTKLINEVSSIDIVPCGECKHWKNGDNACGVCRKTSLFPITKADDYCSYGERKDNEYD